ncbi:hypothetical protein M378DRAFT_165886 [Amanita muscaria Koide BX008]|uniref:Uncharacterized protein n=1 Tax=Amanita muscaria (strain Koide BX008) TaxID=946122 RepID=A0A0C2T6X2_AMAMK|nr:hypothetical protein M378DRAFT_165886 [Amanita muscaria Koide BX008]
MVLGQNWESPSSTQYTASGSMSRNASAASATLTTHLSGRCLTLARPDGPSPCASRIEKGSN